MSWQNKGEYAKMLRKSKGSSNLHNVKYRRMVKARRETEEEEEETIVTFIRDLLLFKHLCFGKCIWHLALPLVFILVIPYNTF